MGSNSEDGYTITGGVPFSDPRQALRQRAEELASKRPSPAEVGLPDSAIEDSQRMLHELQLHQIELQMQNDELRRTQTALDAAQAHYFDLYDLAPVGYCTLSKYGIILEANLTAASLLDFSRSDLLHRPFSRFILAEDQGIFFLHLRKLRGAGQETQEDSPPPSKCELRMTRKDGAHFWAQLTLTTVSAADLAQGPGANIPASIPANMAASAPIFRVVMAYITDLKLAEQALHESEATLNSFFNGTQAMMGIFRILPEVEDLEYLRLNAAAIQRLGIIPKTIPGLRASQSGLSASNRRLWLEHCRLCQESGQPVQFEYQSARINDAWLLATLNSIEPGIFSFAITDVTPLKELQQLNTELEERVAQRTAELSQSNQELQRAVRLRDEFLNNMSHELRTPLTGVLGFSDALQTKVYGELNVDQASAVDTIHINGARLLLLVNNLLELSKLVAGKVVLHPAPVNVDRLIQACLDPVRPEIEHKRLELNIRRDTQMEFLLADEKYLKKVLISLLDNAVKFTPEGGEVGLEIAADPDAGQVRWAVWDSGIGIPEVLQKQIFEPFVQFDGGLSREYGGTGLGLAIVNEVVKLHGGSVEVHSDPGEGTRFTVSLPWQPFEQPAEAVKQQPGW